MRASAVVVAFGLCVALASAHLCLVNPIQRGSADWNKVASNDCLLVSPAPCGGRPAGVPVGYHTGVNVTIVFMKNLDHYNAAAPGNFTITLWNKASGSQKLLATVPDTASPSLTLYSADVVFPRGDHTEGILQVVYHTSNPAAPPAFYQCADITLF